MSRLAYARMFAIGAHSGQTRKWTGEPYWKHMQRVAEHVFPYCGKEGSIVSWLHDTIEDTKVTYEDIEYFFGSSIAEAVAVLTSTPSGAGFNRAQRKARDRENLKQYGTELTHCVKLADIADNVKGLVRLDKDFAKVYLPEKMEMVEILTMGHPSLINLARWAINREMSLL